MRKNARGLVWLPIDALYVLGAHPKGDSPHRLDIAGQKNAKL